MRLVAAVLLLGTVLDVFLVCQALDDDEGEDDNTKYSVQFFQFQPKDLSIWNRGERKNHFKRDIKRNEIDSPVATKNETVAEPVNATVVKSSNDTVAPINATDVAASPTNETSALPVPSNATVVPQNVSASDVPKNTTAPATASDVNIMNALIDLAVQKSNKSSSVNESETIKSNSTSSVAPAPAEPVPVANATAPVANKTKTVDSAAAKRAHMLASAKRDKVLNPNPKPSPQEAALNVKLPTQLENKEHDSMIHKENTTKVSESEDKHETSTESVEMVKNPDPLLNPSPDNGTTTVQNSTSPTVGDEDKKITKDKETNKEITEGAKDISAVQNTFDNSSNATQDLMKEAVVKTGDARAKVQKNAHVTDEKTIKHRKKIAEFVPLYKKASPKDHRLSFQVGSLKHPKHNIHPKCHACPTNSTYKECVKKSTLHECSEGLNNICFTKSSKKNGIITYEMGCSDHNKCVHAKAFPCKDGHEHCFTCCQFDRCNSSPHHGDYELDELNLSELTDSATASSLSDTTTLDSKPSSSVTNTAGVSLTIASTVIATFFL